MCRLAWNSSTHIPTLKQAHLKHAPLKHAKFQTHVLNPLTNPHPPPHPQSHYHHFTSFNTHPNTPSFLCFEYVNSSWMQWVEGLLHIRPKKSLQTFPNLLVKPLGLLLIFIFPSSQTLNIIIFVNFLQCTSIAPYDVEFFF
jgi:hypothetical protein